MSMKKEDVKILVLLGIDAVWAYLVVHYWDVMRQHVVLNLYDTWQYFVVETWYLASILIFCIFILVTMKEIER